MKKLLVLGVLFLLPISTYLFFSSGINHFGRLPVLTENISEINQFQPIDGKEVLLDGNITILTFFGSDLKSKFGNAFNLTHKIYQPFHEFHDLQFVTILQHGNEEIVEELIIELDKITDVSKWKFVYGTEEDIKELFNSLGTNTQLDATLGSQYAFIIDKERKLRGRDDDEDIGYLYGFNTASVAELNNKMVDDVKVLLAEYRLALKKNEEQNEE